MQHLAHTRPAAHSHHSCAIPVVYTALAVYHLRASQEVCSARVGGKQPLMAQDNKQLEATGPGPGDVAEHSDETALCTEPSISSGWATSQ